MQSDLMDRIPPHNEDHERAVLGSMMLDKESAILALDILTADDFYIGKHKKIFTAILKLISHDEPADILILEEVLRKSNRLDESGGPDYLHNILGSVPSAAHIEHYAAEVKEKSIRRKIIQNAMKTIQHSYNGFDLEELLDHVSDGAMAVSEDTLGGGFRLPADAVRAALDEIDKGVSRGLQTGFLDWDRLTRGLQPGTFNILAGLPSQGKSTLALNVALSVAKKKRPVGVVLMEGTEKEYASRAMACLARCAFFPDSDNILRDNEKTQLHDAGQDFVNMPILLDSGVNQTINSIRSRSRIAVKLHKIELLVIDYIQLISVPRKETIFEQVSVVSVGLKNIAKELNIPILALSQFNREASKEKRPRMSQMRGSGQLEQDADTVLIVHDNSVYMDKNRNGPQGVFELTHFPEQFRFENHIQGQSWNT